MKFELNPESVMIPNPEGPYRPASARRNERESLSTAQSPESTFGQIDKSYQGCTVRPRQPLVQATSGHAASHDVNICAAPDACSGFVRTMDGQGPRPAVGLKALQRWLDVATEILLTLVQCFIDETRWF